MLEVFVLLDFERDDVSAVDLGESGADVIGVSDDPAFRNRDQAHLVGVPRGVVVPQRRRRCL